MLPPKYDEHVWDELPFDYNGVLTSSWELCIKDGIEEADFEEHDLEDKLELVFSGADFEQRPSNFVVLDPQLAVANV